MSEVEELRRRVKELEAAVAEFCRLVSRMRDAGGDEDLQESFMRELDDHANACERAD